MSVKVGLFMPRYIVGELEVEVELLPNRVAVLEEFGMPDVRDLWGWRFFRKTERSTVDLACESVARTLGHGVIDVNSIDALVFCCNAALNYHEQNRFLGELTTRLNLPCVFVTWVGGAACASLFSAIQIASSLVRSGDKRNVLVVTVDRTERDQDRFQRFGVLSDAACSFVVRAAESGDFVICATEVLSSPSALANGGNDFQEKAQLIYAVFDRVNRACEYGTGDISAFFGSNVFLPVQELELSVMPIDGLLAFQENTARYGHCFSCDPVINLVDFFDANASAHAGRTLMASSGHGHFGVVLLDSSGA